MDLKRRLENKLEEIADFLLTHENNNKEIGTLNGISGNAMFHFYYANYKDDDRHRQKGSEIIYEVFNRIKKGYTYPTFCDGIAGACWVIELLSEEKFIELEEDIITEELDLYLLKKMKTFISSNNFDFLHGAIGIGIYFLKRFKNQQSADIRNRYEEYLSILINAIENQAIILDNTVSWKSMIISGEYKSNGYNLGLAHGIPSIISFLTKMIQHKPFRHQVTKLLKPACNYMISCKHKDTGLTSSFPNWIIEEKHEAFNSRLAWCYGDLGAGISLFNASKALMDQSLINESLQILEKTTIRKDIKEARVKDTALCHGSYGVTHIYNYLYSQTKKIAFKETSDYWANTSLDLAIHQDGYAGYKQYDGTKWVSNSNILNGVSGIGLVLLSFLEPTYSKWDEALLVR